MTTWRLPLAGAYYITYNALYDNGVAVPTCATCRMLIYGKSDTWKGASWLTKHIYWCDCFEKKLLLEPCRTKACIHYWEIAESD